LRILIAGGTGFVGKNLTESLSRTYGENNVTAVGQKDGNLTSVYEFSKVMYKHRPNVLVHAAGFVGGIGFNAENPGLMIKNNLAMGLNAVEQALEYRCKLVMLGTVCAYPKFTPVPFKEEDLWSGYPEETNAPYGIAKKTIMKMVETYHEQFGLNAVNLIPVNMYGPHDHFNTSTSHVIPALILKVLRAKKYNTELVVWGDGSASREFLYVEDLAEAVVQAIENDPGPEPINIGTGSEITIRDLVTKICDIIEFKGDIVWDDFKPNGQPRRCLDTTRAKDRLNFESNIGLDSGLKKTINWFVKNYNINTECCNSEVKCNEQ
jgi:GDP-L-fucose synthase